MRLPEEFCGRMRKLLGPEAEEFFQSYERGRNYRALRVNTLKGSAEEFDRKWPETLRRVPWTPEGRYFGENAAASARPGRHPYHAAGAFYIQEPSAMAPAELLARGESLEGLRVLDLCAAPGGKTTQLAGKMAGLGVLVSNEVIPERAKILSQNVERMGIRNAFVISEEVGRIAAAFPGWFDRVMVDAPCSGEGMFRKEEAALTEWSVDNIRRCAERQREILDAAAECVCRGGYLLYSTCTFAPEEDEGSAAEFLRAHPDFHVVPVRRTAGMSSGHPEWVPGAPEEIREAVRFWPHLADGEGHFMILLRRDGGGSAVPAEAGTSRASAKPGDCGRVPQDLRGRGRRRSAVPAEAGMGNTRRGRTAFRKPAVDLAEAERLFAGFAAEALALPEESWDLSRLFYRNDRLWLLPEEGDEVQRRFSAGGISHVLRRGLELGEIRNGRFAPAHALALALRPAEARKVRDYPADSAEIRAYLHGEAIREAAGGKTAADEKEYGGAAGSASGGKAAARDMAEKGWVLIAVDGYSCGFARLAGGVLKNHYPRGLRTKY